MNTSPLLDLQKKIYAAIADDSAVEWANSEALIATNPGESLTADFRLAIYANAYVSRLTECLAKDFVTVRKILDPEDFQSLVIDYISSHQPNSPNINEVGHAFSKFILEHRFNQHIPFLGELAALEWAVHFTHYAPLAAPFDFSKLSTTSETEWLGAQFELTSSLQVIDSHWPVIDLWHARNSEAQLETATAELQPGATKIAVYRSPAGVFVERLGAMQALTLDLMKDDMTLAEISRSLGAHDVDDTEIMTWFSNWAANKIISNVKFN